MQKVIFRKRVSKGGRFNQIYIPKELENEIEVGDEVEVKLIKKCTEMYYSGGLKRLSGFKEDLIRGIFSFLGGFDGILDVFVVGSFLFRKIDYGDVDVVIITEKKVKDFDEFVYDKLTEKFNLKFHILSIEKERFEYLLKACPLTQTMFSSYVSNKEVSLDKGRVIDTNHLRFLLMMPEDLLEIRLNNKVFFDNLRRLITIERFLDGRKLDPMEVDLELNDILGKKLYERLKDNEEINEMKIEDIRKIMKVKLKKIKEMIQNGKKG